MFRRISACAAVALFAAGAVPAAHALTQKRSPIVDELNQIQLKIADREARYRYALAARQALQTTDYALGPKCTRVNRRQAEALISQYVAMGKWTWERAQNTSRYIGRATRQCIALYGRIVSQAGNELWTLRQRQAQLQRALAGGTVTPPAGSVYVAALRRQVPTGAGIAYAAVCNRATAAIVRSTPNPGEIGAKIGSFAQMYCDSVWVHISGPKGEIAKYRVR